MRGPARRLWAMLGLLAAPAAQAGVPQANAQVWGEVDLTVPVAPNVSATALAVDRNGEGLPNPTLAGGGLTLDARAGHWTFTLGDLGVAARSAVSGKTVDVDVPLGAVAYGWSLAGLNFDDRSRIERLDGLPGDPWRYRNRLQVSHPLEGLGPIGAVFASDEAFYDFSRQKWDRNRAQVGFSVHVARRQRLDIYYLRQDDRYARPGTLHALGLAYRVVLR